GAEGSARTRDDDDAHGVGRRQHAQRFEQILAHVRINGVELVGTVERRRPDVIGDLDEHALVRRHQTRSTIIAMPWPTRMRIVTKPHCVWRREKAWTSVVNSLAPVHPSGWPRAMPPP